MIRHLEQGNLISSYELWESLMGWKITLGHDSMSDSCLVILLVLRTSDHEHVRCLCLLIHILLF
jgi:hypothetical protein